MNIAVIHASGMGKRMEENGDRAFLELGGKPLIFYAIKNLEQSESVDVIIIVAKKEELEDMKSIVEYMECTKVQHIIHGGTERQNAMRYGLRCVYENYDDGDIVALFYNGTHPFVSSDEITRIAHAARECGAATAAQKTEETVRRTTERNFAKGVVEENELLWNMCSPQAIKLEIARAAFDRAAEDGFAGVDEASLVERIGGDVMIVPVSENNFSITTPTDLALAEIILARDGES